MILVPKSVSRLAYRSLLKLNASSPTILVVAGVAGLGATAVLAARATRNIDPILEQHDKRRAELATIAYQTDRQRQQDLLNLYTATAIDMTRLYGPTLLIGTLSAVSVFGGHKILRTRHVATMAAYTGLLEQFKAYRGRVASTLGKEIEQSIFEGAVGEYMEDPDHKGEYALKAKFEDQEQSYLRPWFDEVNVHWTKDPLSNYLFLKGTQQHMNNLLQTRGHVFLNDVFDQLRIPRCPEGAVAGWIYSNKPDHPGDNYVDFGFMSSNDPNTVAFRNQMESRVRLNFNIDGTIWNLI